MHPHDLVYKEVYKQCKALGIDEMICKDSAQMCLEDFKKGKFTKPSKLITDYVANAKKRSLKKKKDK